MREWVQKSLCINTVQNNCWTPKLFY